MLIIVKRAAKKFHRKRAGSQQPFDKLRTGSEYQVAKKGGQVLPQDKLTMDLVRLIRKQKDKMSLLRPDPESSFISETPLLRLVEQVLRQPPNL